MDLLRRPRHDGFGLPAAIGASVGSQRDFKGRKPVWLIAGDGSFQMTSEELTTAFLDHAPVKIAIINNSVYGMVRQWQTLFFEQHYSQTNLADGDSKESGEFFDVPDFVSSPRRTAASLARSPRTRRLTRSTRRTRSTTVRC